MLLVYSAATVLNPNS